MVGWSVPVGLVGVSVGLVGLVGVSVGTSVVGRLVRKVDCKAGLFAKSIVSAQYAGEFSAAAKFSIFFAIFAVVPPF